MVEPDATAVVALLPTDQGGRLGPTPPEWFGCVLTTASRNYDVRLLLEQPLEPGMTRRVRLAFLDREAAFGMSPGLVFGLWEGREIGFGRIEQVHRANPLAA